MESEEENTVHNDRKQVQKKRQIQMSPILRFSQLFYSTINPWRSITSTQVFGMHIIRACATMQFISGGSVRRGKDWWVSYTTKST